MFMQRKNSGFDLNFFMLDLLTKMIMLSINLKRVATGIELLLNLDSSIKLIRPGSKYHERHEYLDIFTLRDRFESDLDSHRSVEKQSFQSLPT